MKVLQSGTPGGDWRAQVKCTGYGNGNHGCAALLEVEASDLFHTQRSDWRGDTTEHFVTIECPECKEWTDLKNDAKVPYKVERTVHAMKPRVQQS